MPRIAQSVIEEIRQLNIADIISPHVDFVRKGRTVMGLCPFHSEKTPSFHVHEDKGFFKCFGCNEAGDGITFIMKHRNLDYVDAVTYLCEHFNIDLKYESDGAPQKPVKDIKALHEMFAERAKAGLFTPEGAQALKYLTGRGFGEDIIKRFDIGWVPPGINAAAFEKSFPKNVLTESGIFFDTKYGMKCHFEARILFPIRSATGACVAFSGRTMDPNEKAKYKNSMETPIFSKRRELYNLHSAKEAMKDDKSCYIVEGYFDVIRMVEAGYPQTVAIMGTAFTREQVAQLKRYAEEYNLVLDGDEAGVKAMRDSRVVALDSNIYPNVIFLPAGDDPDTFLKNNGRDAFDKLLQTRRDLLTYTIETERAKGTDANRRFHRLEGIKRMLELIKDPYRREYYAKETARVFEVSEETLRADVNISRAKTTLAAQVKKARIVDYPVEKNFITYLFQLPEDVLDRTLSDMSPECFEDDICRGIYKKIVELSAQGDNITTLINDEEFGETVANLLIHKQNIPDFYAAVIDCKNTLLNNYRNKERGKLASQIVSTDDMDSLTKYLEQARAVSKHQMKTYNGES